MAQKFNNHTKGNKVGKNVKGGSGRNKYNMKKRPQPKNFDPANAKDDTQSKTVTTYESNDISWYTVDPQMIQDAGRVAFTNALGSVFNRYKEEGITKAVEMPSLLNIRFMPTPGYTNPYKLPGTRTASAPVNVMARAMQSHIQSTVSTKLPFNAADLAIHLMAMDSIYMLLAWAQRIYGVWQNFMVFNRTVPYVYFDSFGLSLPSMEDDMSMSTFRAKINRWAYDFSRLWIPKDLKVCLRHSWLCSKIFTDKLSDKAQQYIFNPAGFWRFELDENKLTKDQKEIIKNRKAGKLMGNRALSGDGLFASSGAGKLTWVEMPDFTDTGLKGVYDFIETFISEYYTDLDTWTINGYLARAYGETGRFRIGLIGEDFRISPDYDETALLQIHNMSICGNPILNGNYKPQITQNEDDTLTCEIYTGSPDVSACNANVFLDMPMDVPSPEAIIEATRLKVVAAPWTPVGVDPMALMIYFGTEVVTSITIYSDTVKTRTSMVLSGTLDLTYTDHPIFSMDTVDTIAQLSTFDHGPFFYTGDRNKYGDTSPVPLSDANWIRPLGNVQNYTVIGEDALALMHDAAVMGEFYIPEISKH